MKHESHSRSVGVGLCAGERSHLAQAGDDEMSRAALYGYMPPSQLQPQRVASRNSPARSRSRGFVLFASAAVAGVALAAHYEILDFAPQAESPALEWTPLPQRQHVETIEEALPPPPPPTRYANPFDRTEVFELPPGLSREEARQMVADILMERARERGVR